MIYEGAVNKEEFASEREILYKILFDMKKDMADLKKVVQDIISSEGSRIDISESSSQIMQKLLMTES